MKLGLLVDLPEGLPLFFVSGPRNDPRTREQVASHLCFSCSNCFLIFGFLLAYFERLVLGCVEADFCKEVLNTRLKALDEIYKIYTLLIFWNPV